ncbi:SDR family oxidoreductase [Parvularcula sp. ZS-1/3]|uniref:SDR family oxidoreductase n=1 Tax=Parvularcula mediterranea TaxID=2732508 RepID=A0A7Y3RKN2_9PROT|nr:SDR family oxidoreductase [Parvularcula mediterranea]NNU15824.1 SDR family oxidoreductase [Parvularcula mediterranea]
MTTVLITGANRGIGLEFVRHYAGEGAKVHACCRTPEEARDLKAVSGDVTVHALDTTNQGQLDAVANSIEEPVDIVIANAGVYGRSRSEQSFEALSADELNYTLNVNVTGSLKTLQAFLPHVRKGEGKKMVAITSKMGSIEDASGGAVAYRASKTALNMVMSAGAFELKGEGIAVGTLHPGWVRTDMGGPNGNISPEESAKGLAKVIDGLQPADKAAFLDYAGKEIPW